MALGTITVTERGDAPGPIRVDVVSFAGDSSYPTGGSAFKAALLAALGITNYEIIGVLPLDTGGYGIGYDKTAGKLKAYACAAAASPMGEVANATNLSGVTFKVAVISH